MKRTASSNYIILFAFILGWSFCSDIVAQTDANFTQYWAIPNYYNAAATGTTDYINIHAGTRMQWVGIPKAPQTILATAETPFKFLNKRFGAGLVFNQESIGLYKNLNVGAQFSYRLKILKGQLNIGLQIGIVNEVFKGSEVKLPDGDSSSDSSETFFSRADSSSDSGGSSSSTDEGIPTSDVKGTSFDAALGAFYTHKYFWLGISATHLNQPMITLSADGSSDKLYEAKVGRTFYFMAGSNIPIKNTLFELQPSLLVRSDLKITQVDVSARVRYKKFISFGVGYRTQDAVSAMISAEFKSFFLGYSYDYPLSAISKVTNGSHEVFLGYKLKLDLGDKNKNKHKSIRIM